MFKHDNSTMFQHVYFIGEIKSANFIFLLCLDLYKFYLYFIGPSYLILLKCNKKILVITSMN